MARDRAANPDPTSASASAPPSTDGRARRAHFNHAGASLPSAAVVARVVDHLHLEAEIGGYEAAEQVAGDLIAARQAVGSVVGAPAEDVVLVESATQAWTTIAWSLALSHGWGPADRVVVDNFAYVSSWAVLAQLRAVLGVGIEVAPVRGDGTIDAEGLAARVDPTTRLVLVTHVPTHVGTVTAMDEVAIALERARARIGDGTGPVFAVDISQSLGQLPIDMAQLGCQVAFAPGRKFLRAPRGTGVLAVTAELAETLTPLGPDLTSTTEISTRSVGLAPGAARFELFEHSVALRLGLGRAAQEVLDLGIDHISDQVARRTRAVVEAVAAVPALHLVAAGPVHGIVSFTHDQLDPAEVRRRLGRSGVNAWTNVANASPVDGERRGLGPSVRLSPHHTTSDDDLERLGRALHELG